MDWIEWGYIGLFVASFLAATILPIASEAVFIAMLFSFNPWVCLFVATTGNTLGGYLNYGIGYLGKPEWLAKIRVTEDQISHWEHKVKRYGVWLALGTWLPFVGDVIAVALGFFKTAWKPTFLFIFIGKFARYLLILLFYLYVQ